MYYKYNLPGKLEIIRKFSVKPSQGDFYEHSHNCYEILYFFQGDVSIMVNGKEYSVMPDSLIFLDIGTRHRICIKSETAYERIVMQISRAFLEKCVGGHSVSEFLATGRTVSHSCFWCNRELKNYIENLDQTITDAKIPEALREVSVISNAIAAFSYIQRSTYSDSYAVSSINQSEILRDIIDYINGNFSSKITLDLLCSTFFVSKATINNLFKSYTGTTFYKFLTERRLKYARTLLDSGQKACDVALASGFEDYSAFYRAYRKHYGTPPRDKH